MGSDHKISHTTTGNMFSSSWCEVYADQLSRYDFCVDLVGTALINGLFLCLKICYSTKHYDMLCRDEWEFPIRRIDSISTTYVDVINANNTHSIACNGMVTGKKDLANNTFPLKQETRTRREGGISCLKRTPRWLWTSRPSIIYP